MSSIRTRYTRRLPRHRNMNDEDLISRLLAGEPEVVELVRGWMRLAFTPYRSRLASELEDVEQESLIDLLSALRAGRFRRHSRLRTYVRTYVTHKCIDRLRATTRREWLDVEDLDLTSQAPDPMDRLTRSEATDLGLRVLEEMPDSCRELWQMLQQNMSYREMGERLGVSEGALRVRVLRCRKRALEMREKIRSKSL